MNMPTITKQQIQVLGMKAGFQHDSWPCTKPGYIEEDKDLLAVEEYQIGEEIIKFVELLGFEVTE